MELTPIGSVRSPVREPVDEGWGSVVAEIVLEPQYAAGTQGLEQYSHVLVLFLMHQATFDRERHLVRRPRGLADMPEVGIFAQRAKHRPCPIGVTAVKLLSVQGGVLSVQGLDAIDGTPVLDIKPYVAAYDRVEAPREPAWLTRLMEGYF